MFKQTLYQQLEKKRSYITVKSITRSQRASLEVELVLFAEVINQVNESDYETQRSN